MNPERLEDDMHFHKADGLDFGNGAKVAPAHARQISNWAPPVVIGRTPFAQPSKHEQIQRMTRVKQKDANAQAQLELYGYLNERSNTKALQFGVVGLVAIFVLFTWTRCGNI